MGSLLAVDLGLRAGLALYGDDGRLRWYRSQNFGTLPRMRRAAHSILQDLPDLQWLVLEGGGPLAEIWQKEAVRREVKVFQTSAEVWRQALLYPRQQRSGADAKQHADQLARRIIDWSGAPRPTSLRHDAAEAILIGLWGVVQVGWLPAVPIANG
ncbi:MAG: hypothetical protein R3E79_10700 [Caldilineaceae bacterium]